MNIPPRIFSRILWVCMILCPMDPIFAQTPSPPENLLSSVDEIAKKISELRQLPFKSPVNRALKSRSEIESYIKNKLYEEYTPEDIKRETKAMVKWGIWPQDTDFLTVYLTLMTEQVAGFYDPKVKTFYVADWISQALQAPIMAHELTHALQDQYFDLETRIKKQRGNDDQVLAQMALIEGEGLAVMIDYMFHPMGVRFESLSDLDTLIEQQMSKESFPSFSKAPLILQTTLMFPYIYGLRFLKAALERGSWADIAKIYDDLPTSTEQVIHPERYFDERDHPVKIDPAPLQHKLGQPLCTNMLGELGFRVLFELQMDKTVALNVSEGWDGDLYLAWEKEQRILLASLSVWDSLADTLEFFGGYQKIIARKYSVVSPIEHTVDRIVFRVEKPNAQPEIVALSRYGNIVLLIEGFSPKLWQEVQSIPLIQFIQESALPAQK